MFKGKPHRPQTRRAGRPRPQFMRPLDAKIVAKQPGYRTVCASTMDAAGRLEPAGVIGHCFA